MKPETKWKLRNIVLPGVVAIAVMITLGTACWIDKAREYAVIEYVIALYLVIGTVRIYRSHAKFVHSLY